MSDISLPLSKGSFCTSTVMVFSTNESRVMYTIELTWIIATIRKATNSLRFLVPIMNILKTTYSRNTVLFLDFNTRIFDPTLNSAICWSAEKIYISPSICFKNTITKALKRMDRAIRLRLVSWECLYTLLLSILARSGRTRVCHGIQTYCRRGGYTAPYATTCHYSQAHNSTSPLAVHCVYNIYCAVHDSWWSISWWCH